jgi:hypothetical protein
VLFWAASDAYFLGGAARTQLFARDRFVKGGDAIFMSTIYKTLVLSGLASSVVLTAMWIGFLGYEAIKLIKFLL